MQEQTATCKHCGKGIYLNAVVSVWYHTKTGYTGCDVHAEPEEKEVCQGGCTYSRAFEQPIPRLCVKCGKPEVTLCKHCKTPIEKDDNGFWRHLQQVPYCRTKAVPPWKACWCGSSHEEKIITAENLDKEIAKCERELKRIQDLVDELNEREKKYDAR